jgi:thymidylate kinase
MLYFLEGPDGAGKSNLAKRLSEQTGFEIRHFSYPKTAYKKHFMFETYSDFIHENHNVIVDRCWYSEMVYGPLVRTGSAINKHEMYELEKLVISEGGGIIIHCTDSIAKLWCRFRKRGDDYIPDDFDLLYDIKRNYELLMHKTAHLIPVVRYEINENLPRL